MKTAEELRAIAQRLFARGEENDPNFLYEVAIILENSDQQNKELREKVEKYEFIYKLIGAHPMLEDWSAEIQRLTKEVEELKLTVGGVLEKLR